MWQRKVTHLTSLWPGRETEREREREGEGEREREREREREKGEGGHQAQKGAHPQVTYF
jgi:hypothetical protein